AVDGVTPARVGEVVVEQRLVPPQVTLDRLAVRVEQQLGRLAAKAAQRVVPAVHPVAVALPGFDARQVGMPDEAVDLGEVDSLFAAVTVEQAQLDPLGDLGEQGEVGTPSVPCSAERIRRSGPGTHPPPSSGYESKRLRLIRPRASPAPRPQRTAPAAPRRLRAAHRARVKRKTPPPPATCRAPGRRRTRARAGTSRPPPGGHRPRGARAPPR